MAAHNDSSATRYGEQEDTLPSYESEGVINPQFVEDENRIRDILSDYIRVWNDQNLNDIMAKYTDDIVCITKNGTVVNGSYNLKRGIRHKLQHEWRKLDIHITAYWTNIFINDEGETCVSYNYRSEYEIKSSKKIILCILCVLGRPKCGWQEGHTELKLRVGHDDKIRIYHIKSTLTAEQRID